MSDSTSGPSDVVCSCCGRTILDTAAENVWHDLKPYPGDFGTGMCRACGGDPEANDPRERLGFALCVFVDVRIPIVAKRLSERNRERFLAMDYELKATFVLELVARGHLT